MHFISMNRFYLGISACCRLSRPLVDLRVKADSQLKDFASLVQLRESITYKSYYRMIAWIKITVGYRT
jgi:hypothetical protein